MKIKKEYLILGFILLIAALLRFWQLGHIPISPDWDEAALGYNAYSVMLTGKDEYGKFLPIVLQSFNDYKPALYMYLVIPSIKLLGLTVFAVRLPSAIMGLIAVFTTYFLVKELFDRKNLALLTAFLMAISPWHIQFSRVAFEANTGLTFNLLLILFFLKGLKKSYFLLPAALFAGLNIYVYQADKVFTPLLVLILTLIYRKELFSISKKYLFSAVFIGIIIVLPMVLYTFTTKGSLTRVEGTSIFEAPIPISNIDLAAKNLKDKQNHDIFGLVVDNRRVVYAKEIIGNYFYHYDLNWLFIQGEDTNPLNNILRHQATGMGNLYIFDIPFLLIGIYILFFGEFKKSTKFLIFLWFLAVPIPASITWDVPNSVRTLNFLPTFQIFIALGLFAAYNFAKRFRFGFVLLLLVAVFGFFNFTYYLDQYFVQYNYFSSSYWQYGYEKLIPDIQKIQNNYKKVVISSTIPLDQSYIFFLFYLKYPPEKYVAQNSGASGEFLSYHKIGKYEFRVIDWSKESPSRDTLYVSAPASFPSNTKNKFRVLDQINFLDGIPGIDVGDVR